MRSAVLILLVSATAAADPAGVETSAEVSAALPMGATNGNNAMSRRVNATATLGLGVGYAFSPRTSAGAYVEYGLGDAPDAEPCLSCGYTVTSSVRVLRAGVYGRRRYGDLVVASRIGYEQLSATYGGFGSENRDSWRGVELLRPEVGYAAYETPRANVVLYAAASLGVFEYMSANGNGWWLNDVMTDTPDGPSIHGWLMVGTRVGFQTF